MSGLMRHGMAKCNNPHYKLSGAQYATRLHIDETSQQLFSSSRLSYSTILNVIKHGKGRNKSKLNIQASLNEAGRTNNNSGKSSCAYDEFGTFCPKTYFNIVKQ